MPEDFAPPTEAELAQMSPDRRLKMNILALRKVLGMKLVVLAQGSSPEDVSDQIMIELHLGGHHEWWNDRYE